jgi:Uma2 family endonuclease
MITQRQWNEARHRPFVDGCPILASRIIGPSDTHGDITDAVHEYLCSGVKAVWVIDPDFETVFIYRQDAEPVLLNRQQELTCEPNLPSVRVRVADLFE